MDGAQNYVTGSSRPNKKDNTPNRRTPPNKRDDSLIQRQLSRIKDNSPVVQRQLSRIKDNYPETKTTIQKQRQLSRNKDNYPETKGQLLNSRFKKTVFSKFYSNLYPSPAAPARQASFEISSHGGEFGIFPQISYALACVLTFSLFAGPARVGRKGLRRASQGSHKP
jgi:hypothetical protein